MKQFVLEKLLQWFVSIAGGLLIAFESSIVFFVPCLIIVALDVLSAYCLGRRVHKKYPDKADGKFKSENKFRIFFTMLIGLILIICANYVDVYIIKDSDTAVRFVVGVFIIYNGWSVLENWSSENNNKIARALQRIMVNKAERHLNVPLEDIFFEKSDKKENKDETTV